MEKSKYPIRILFIKWFCFISVAIYWKCVTLVITGNVYNKVQFLIKLGSVLARFHYVCSFKCFYCVKLYALLLTCLYKGKTGTLSVCHVCDIMAYFLGQIWQMANTAW